MSLVVSVDSQALSAVLDKLYQLTSDMTSVMSYDAQSATIGFGDPKAAYHEFGTKHMPRRGLLFADPYSRTLSPDDERALIDIVTIFLESAID